MQDYPMRIILAIVSLLALTAGCCTQSDTLPGDTTVELRNTVDDVLREVREAGGDVPGIVVGVWGSSQGISFTYAEGVADRATNEPLTTGHHFKVASVTKTMVTTAAAQLIDEGLLSYDHTIDAWFPGLPGADAVTIRMLGGMTSGYFDYLEDEDFLDSFDNTPNFTATPQELIAVGMGEPPLYPPGEGFNYSNTNTVILAQIIEQISGQPLEQVLAQRLFTPLGMESSGAPASGSFLPEPRAHSYHPATGQDWTELMDYSPEYACGNAYSNLHEMKTWVEALARGEMLSPATHAQRFAGGSAFPGAPEFVYHFGVIDYRGFLGHSGNTDYYLTQAFHNPELGATVVILANSSAVGVTSSLLAEIITLLYAEG
jgi:D-alanyl-D-alanine carboxypeptidase